MAGHYGINLRGSGRDIRVVFDPTLGPGLDGVTRASEGGRVIRVGRNAVQGGDAAVANTIAHELSHARYYLRHGTFDGEQHGNAGSIADGTPCGSGNALKNGSLVNDESNGAAEMTTWRNVPEELVQAWSRLFGVVWYDPGIRVDAQCPNCGERGLHQFYIRHEVVAEDGHPRPDWLVERIRRAGNAADGVEWCAQCRLFDHVKDKACPPGWSDTDPGIHIVSGTSPESIIVKVMNYLADYDDPPQPMS